MDTGSGVSKPKIRLALITTVMDNRSGRGTALVARELVQRVIERTDLFYITLIHHEKTDAQMYTDHRTLQIPHLPKPFDRQLTREAWFWLQLRMRGEKFDIVHYLNPRIWPSYLLTPGKVVVTMHEAGIMLDLHPHSIGDRVFQFTYRFLHQRLARVIAVSEFGKKEIAQYCRIPLERISVLLNALPDTFSVSNRTDLPAFLSEKFGIPSPYILSVGRFDPHKNILRLIEAYAIARNNGVTAHLVLVGGRHLEGYSNQVTALITSLGLEGHVYAAPYIPEEDLPDVYRGAQALIYPSLHEGFGMPLLEAMQAGTPIIASSAGSLPEIAGDAALLFDPYDPEAMAESIRTVLTDEALRQKLKENGSTRLKSFSWEKSANKLIALYQSM